MSQLFTLPQQVRLNSSGTPYASAQAYFYRIGTQTAQDVYTTPDLTTPHSQPVSADAAGQWPAIWLDPAADYDYRVIIKTSADVTLDDYPYPRNAVSAVQIGRAFYPQTATEQAASVTPTTYLYPPGDVRRYGAVCDGVTDDAVAIQKALTVGGRVTIPSGKACLVNTGLTMDAATTTFDLQGGSLSSGLVSAGYVLNIGSSSGAEACTRNSLRNGYIGGSGVAGVVALNFEDATNVIAGFNVDGISIYNFAGHARFYTNAFCINFSGCTFSGGSVGAYIPSGGSNYGEKITFNHCFFSNITEQALLTGYDSGQFYLVNCSLDYCKQVAKTTAGWIFLNNCYVESNLDTARWFECATGESCKIFYRGGQITVTGAKTAAPLAGADTNGVIHFEDVLLYSATNSVGGDFLGDGAGLVLAKRCKIAGFLNSVYAWAGGSTAQNMCSNGDFTSNITGWTTGSNTAGGGGYPTRNATAGSSGGPALEMYVDTAANDQSIYWEIAAEPGDIVGAAFSSKSENVSASVNWQIQCLGNDDVVVGSSDSIAGVTSFDASSPAASTNWIDRRVTISRCPAGTTKARLIFGADYVGGYKAWIEDVSMCKY